MSPTALPCHFAGCGQRAQGSSSSCGGHGAGRVSLGNKEVECIVCGAVMVLPTAARAKTCSQECKRQRRASQQAIWKQANKERISRTEQARYARLRDELVSYQAAYRATRPDQIRVRKRHYKATRRAHESSTRKQITQRDMNRMLSRYAGHCAYCWVSTTEVHWDHVLPLARGGYTGKGNLLPVCPSCNMSKGAKLLSEWRRDRLTFLTADNEWSGLRIV